MTDRDTLLLLAGDTDETVRLQAGLSCARDETTHAELVALDDPVVANELVGARITETACEVRHDLQVQLAESAHTSAKELLASHTQYSDVFDRLLTSGDVSVRAACAENPRIGADHLAHLVVDSRREVRGAVAQSAVRRLSKQQWMQLARDRSADVRWCVVAGPEPNLEAAELLVGDSDEIVAQQAQRVVGGGSIYSPDLLRDERAKRRRQRRLPRFGA